MDVITKIRHGLGLAELLSDIMILSLCFTATAACFQQEVRAGKENESTFVLLNHWPGYSTQQIKCITNLLCK